MEKIKLFLNNPLNKNEELKFIEDSILEETVANLNLNNQAEKKYNIDLIKNNVLNLLKITNDKKHILINGRVQSGKTNILVNLIASINNRDKYDLVIYLTGRLNDLNKQNNSRFVEAFSNNKNFYAKTVSNLKDVKINDVILNGRTAIYSIIKYSDKYEGILKIINENNLKVLLINDEGDDYTFTENFMKFEDEILNNEESKLITITASPFKNLDEYINRYDSYFALKESYKYSGIDSFEYQTVSELNGIKSMLKESLRDWMSKIDFPGPNQFLINIENEQYKHDYIYSLVEEIMDDEFINGNEVARKLKIEDYISIMNGDKENIFDLEYSNSSNNTEIIIGSNKLSRGITFKNLTGELITVNSEGKVSSGTLIQKARWCGYRDVKKTHIYMNQKCKDCFVELIKLERETLDYEFGSEYSLKDFERIK